MRKLTENVLAVGAIDWDRRLFDELIPLPDGTTYNAYLVRGENKTALIDTVDPTKAQILLDNLAELGTTQIDYIISHHAEQDHSGAIPAVLAKYPMARVVTNQRCSVMLKDLLLIPEEKFMVIEDRQVIELGGLTLEFIFTPWVHWPETMCTYLRDDKILFSCDFFGSHLATSNLYAEDKAKVYRSAKRYYAEIMMPFRTSIKQNLLKLKDYQIDMLAPSHGPVHPQAALIMEAYQDWISDQVKNEVIVPYVSMHGSTQVMVSYFIDKLISRGIEVKPFDLPKTDIGELAMALVDAATIVIGSPTVLVGAHPAAAYAAFLANALRPKAQFASVIGSFGWGGKMVEQLTGLMPALKVEILPPVVAKGYPKEGDFQALDQLVEGIVEKHRGLNIL